MNLARASFCGTHKKEVHAFLPRSSFSLSHDACVGTGRLLRWKARRHHQQHSSLPSPLRMPWYWHARSYPTQRRRVQQAWLFPRVPLTFCFTLRPGSSVRQHTHLQSPARTRTRTRTHAFMRFKTRERTCIPQTRSRAFKRARTHARTHTHAHTHTQHTHAERFVCKTDDSGKEEFHPNSGGRLRVELRKCTQWPQGWAPTCGTRRRTARGGFEQRIYCPARGCKNTAVLKGTTGSTVPPPSPPFPYL